MGTATTTQPLNPLSEWASLRRMLCARRAALGMTQTDVAARGAFGLRSLERWESGDAEPGAFALFCWCRALGVSLVPTIRDANHDDSNKALAVNVRANAEA